MKKISVILLLVILSLSINVYSGGETRRVTEPMRAPIRFDYHLGPKDYENTVRKMALSISKARWFKKARVKFNWLVDEDMQNDTDEHIRTSVIMRMLMVRLIKKQHIRFIDLQTLHEKLKRKNLNRYILKKKNVPLIVFKISKARLLIRGRISNIRERIGLTAKKAYILSFEIIDLVTARVMWMDQVKILKGIRRRSYR